MSTAAATSPAASALAGRILALSDQLVTMTFDDDRMAGMVNELAALRAQQDAAQETWTVTTVNGSHVYNDVDVAYSRAARLAHLGSHVTINGMWVAA